MAYTKTTWQNDQAPAINATNLNKIEQGIFDNDAGIANLLQEIGINTNTWVSTNTYSLGDVVVYNKKLYKNITGNYTTTNPASDTTNWNEIQIINNNGKLNKSLIPYFNNSNSNATDEGYSCDYINDNFGEIIWMNNTGGGTFAGKNIDASLSEYSKFKIYYYVDTNLSRILSATGNKGDNISCTYSTSYRRTIVLSDTRITIGDGYYVNDMNNNAIIPAYIIGYK